MAEKTFYKLKWETVKGESQSKRFQSKNDPEFETVEMVEPFSPALLRVKADGELVGTIQASNFIHLMSEDK